MILLITHQLERRGRLHDFLVNRGYEVVIPPHRGQVSAIVKEKKPLVILLDLYVAEPSGIEVLRTLRAEGFQGRVVVLAGVSAGKAISQAFQLGIDQVVGTCQATDDVIACEQVDHAIRAALRPQISEKASDLWHERGKPKGKDVEIWLEAEKEILGLL